MKKEEKAHFGQTIRTEGAPDKSSYKTGGADEALVGRKMKGGGTDLSHSLTAGGYNDKGKDPGR